MSGVQSPVETLADAIIVRRGERLESEIKGYPRKNSILSDVAECERYMVYSVLDWDKRPLHDKDLQARFEAGKIWEKQVVKELLDMGFDFQLAQKPVEIKNRGGDIIATGKIDGLIKWNESNVAVEIKSLHPNIFGQINNVDDFKKKPWLRRYTRQLMMYCYGNNVEWGIFVIVSTTGAMKVLPLALDYGEAEYILQRLERVNESIKKKIYPDRITYDQSICGKCPFSHICLPDVINKGADFIDNDVLEADIERHESLKPIVSEYDALHEQIKQTFKNIEKAMVGTRWMIQNIPSQRTTYELPPEVESEIDELKKQYMKKVPMTRLVIEDLKGKVKE